MFAWEKIAREKIKEAMLKGEFDNLPGQGKPVDLSDYFKTPAHLRMAFDILKKSNVLPPVVGIKKDIAALKSQIDKCIEPEQKAKLYQQLQYKEISLQINLEHFKK